MQGRLARILVAVVAGGALSAVSAAPSTAAPLEVDVVDNDFTPSTVRPSVGGQVHWARGTPSVGFHNVREDHLLFRSGDTTPGEIDFTRTFSAGTFYYFCENHSSLGMTGFVKVAPRVASAPGGLPFTVRWATSATNVGSRFDVQYKVGTGAWKSWKNRTTARSAVFGQGSKPVRVRRHKTYRFRAKTRKGDAASRWSPVRSFVVHS